MTFLSPFRGEERPRSGQGEGLSRHSPSPGSGFAAPPSPLRGEGFHYRIP